MRILLLTSYFPPDTGSAATLFHELGIALARRGHAVTVVTSMPAYHARGDVRRYRRKVWMTEAMDGMTVVRVATPARAKRTMVGRAVWQLVSAAAFIAAAIAQPKADVSIVYSPPLPLGITGWLLHRLRGTPFVLNVQDLFPQSAIDLGMLKNRLLISVLRAMERFLYARAASIAVHSGGNREHVVAQGISDDRVSVVANWVDTRLVRPGDRLGPFREQHGIDDRFVISFAGILGYAQDLDVVLEAAAELDERVHLLWLVVGDGVEQPRLVAKAAQLGLKNVRFLPMLPRDEYVLMLQASDVGLATLRAEVTTPVVPSKIISVMAAGLPVLGAFPLDGDAAALIDDARCGICVEPGDAQGMANAAARLASDPALCRELGQHGRRYVEEHFSVERAASQYETIAEKAVGRFKG